MTDTVKTYIEKLKELKSKITKGEWFAVEFAGYWQILDGNHYDSDDINDSANVGEVQSQANAELMAMAPIMLDIILEQQIEEEEKIVSDEEIEKEAINYSTYDQTEDCEFPQIQTNERDLLAFLDGAKWMRDKLLNNQDNG